MAANEKVLVSKDGLVAIANTLREINNTEELYFGVDVIKESKELLDKLKTVKVNIVNNNYAYFITKYSTVLNNEIKNTDDYTSSARILPGTIFKIVFNGASSGSLASIINYNSNYIKEININNYYEGFYLLKDTANEVNELTITLNSDGNAEPI